MTPEVQAQKPNQCTTSKVPSSYFIDTASCLEVTKILIRGLLLSISEAKKSAHLLWTSVQARNWQSMVLADFQGLNENGPYFFFFFSWSLDL